MANTIKTIILAVIISTSYACGGEDKDVPNLDEDIQVTPQVVIVEEIPEINCDVFEECVSLRDGTHCHMTTKNVECEEWTPTPQDGSHHTEMCGPLDQIFIYENGILVDCY
jgi:hypothetical protein